MTEFWIRDLAGNKAVIDPVDRDRWTVQGWQPALAPADGEFVWMEHRDDGVTQPGLIPWAARRCCGSSSVNSGGTGGRDLSPPESGATSGSRRGVETASKACASRRSIVKMGVSGCSWHRNWHARIRMRRSVGRSPGARILR